MNTYTQDNPPKRGNAKKIWAAMKYNDVEVTELHYNPNCWGKGKDMGWGTWACVTTEGEFFAGISQGSAWLQSLHAPFGVRWLKRSDQRYRTAEERTGR